MIRSRDSTFQRRLRIVAVVFTVFILFDIGLFGWLIFNSLSQRELDRILLPARESAEEVARQLEAVTQKGDRDLFAAMATGLKIRIQIDEELLQQDFVQGVEVVDSEGVVVYRSSGLQNRLRDSVEEVEIQRQGELPDVPSSTSGEEFPVSVRIGELGFVRIEMDRVRLEERTAVLRRDLIRRLVVLGSVTVLLLVAAFLCIYWLLRRARRLETQAEDAERLAYVGTLAAGLAHEIRNPLNALNLNMQMLEEDHGDSRLLTITRNEIGRLDGLVSDFLSYARPRPLDLEEQPAVAVLEQAAEVVAGEIKARGVELSVRDDSGGARVAVDTDQMRQLLLNLIRNSLAAVEEKILEKGRKGRLAITLRAATEGEKGEGRRVVLEVADTGMGMTEEEQQRAFEIFYSTRKGGTGLGLAVVERIATAHKGNLEVESSLGEGTRVRLSLPRAGTASESPRDTGRWPTLRLGRSSSGAQ